MVSATPAKCQQHCLSLGHICPSQIGDLESLITLLVLTMPTPLPCFRSWVSVRADLEKTDSEEEASGSDDDDDDVMLPDEEHRDIPGALEEDVRYMQRAYTQWKFPLIISHVGGSSCSVQSSIACSYALIGPTLISA